MQLQFKIIFLLLFPLLSPVMAQERETTSLIQIIYKDIVPKDFKYFYLEDTAYAKKLHEIITEHKNVLEYLIEIDSSFTGKTADDYIIDNNSILWSSYKLTNAVTIPNSSFDSIYNNTRIIMAVDDKFYAKHQDSFKKAAPWNEIFAPVNNKLSKKKKMQRLSDYGDSLDLSIPKERTLCFHFSKPEFTKDYKYAIFDSGNGDSNTVYIYRYQDSTWKQLCPIMVWR